MAMQEEHACTNNCAGGAAGNMEKGVLLEGVNALFAEGAIVRSLVCGGLAAWYVALIRARGLRSWCFINLEPPKLRCPPPPLDAP